MSILYRQGGEADIDTVSKMILTDFQRGKLPYFVAPPHPDGTAHGTKENQKSQSIKFVPASTDEEKATDSSNKESKGEDIARNEESKKRVPGVKQDLTGIHVEPDFIDEDRQGTEGDIDSMEIEGEAEEDVESMEMEEEELSENEVVRSTDVSSEADRESADGLKDNDAKTDCSEKDEDIFEKEVEEKKVNDTLGIVEQTESEHVLKSQNVEQSIVDNGAGISPKLDSETAIIDPSKKARSKKKKTGYQDGEVSFKVLNAEAESSCCSEEENVEARADPIERIKKEVENENEEQILSSLTPEEKAFLGIDDEDEVDERYVLSLP